MSDHSRTEHSHAEPTSMAKRLPGFAAHDPFVQAAAKEKLITFKLGAISWPDQLGPTSIALGSFKAGQKITGPVGFKADVLVILYTDVETEAFLDVFTGNSAWTTARKATWNLYGHNFAAISPTIQNIGGDSALEGGGFGYLNAFQVGNQKVVVFKTELHPKVNGNGLPIVAVIQQLVTDLQVSLVLSTGSAGGMGKVINCGDVAVTSSARFKVSTTYPTYPEINTLSQSGGALTNSVTINDQYIQYAAQNLTKLTLPALAQCYAEFQGRSGYSFLKPNTAAPSIYVTDINPVPGPEPMAIVSADFLSVNDPTNAEGLESLGIMNDNDDAYAFFAISQMPEAQRPSWLSVRNASDPQVVATIPKGASQSTIRSDLSTVAGAIFGVYEYVTTINSAFACWAIVAGNNATSPAHQAETGKHHPH